MTFEGYSQPKSSNNDDYYNYPESKLAKPESLERKEQGLANDLLDQFKDSIKFWKDYGKQVDDKLLKLFDGDKPLEIAGKDKAKDKQDWLVVMNLAVDFGGECTIEKRTKKLQELAAQTEGKDVTIVVQTASKDEKTDKYTLQRFVLKDGKVTELKSPGQSQGYGNDVESLLKYATQTYGCKNLGLILDSHGNGNEGLQGDNGDISMADFKKHIESGLKGSGHDKIDFLQFDACLMAQNGVLESTQSLAHHVVASAEPEGVTADSAAADNINLAALLKNPKMTPDQLAEYCVEQAKNVEGFDTLAHFDMAKYKSFRGALDEFGEGMSKLWKDEKQRAVIQQIIKDTFEYGGHSFRILDLFGGKEKPLGDLQGAGRTERPPKPDSERPDKPHWPRLDEMPKPYLHDLLGGLPSFSRSLGTDKRDLKDFVQRVIKAIDEGKLKDEGGKIKESAEKLLKEGESVTKSFFGRGKHSGLGGLSVYLPQAGGGEAATISTEGGWRQFQDLLKNQDREKLRKR